MSKKMVLKMIAFVMVFTFIFNTRCYGDDGRYTLFYYKDNVLEDEWQSIEFNFNNDFSKEEKIYFLFNTLFTGSDYINFIPKDTKLLDISVIDTEIIINVSGEINNHGGNYYETHLINQIVKNALSIKNVNYVTLLIDGKLEPLNEGLFIYKQKNLVN